jgi:hypothetical protein
MWEPPPVVFFQALAQLHPLLFLAAAFQARNWEHREHASAGTHLLVLTGLTIGFSAMVVGEFATLASLAGPVTKTTTQWAVGTLGINTVTTVVPMAEALRRSISEKGTTVHKVLAWLLAVSIIAVPGAFVTVGVGLIA